MFRIFLPAILGVLLCGATAGPQTPFSVAGYWTGGSHTVRTANLDVVTIKITYTSQFWFAVAADNTVKGEAIATYDLGFNDAKLRTLLAQANASGSSMLRATPQLGGLLDIGVSSRDAIGMRMAYDEGTPVRRGPITGSIANGRLTLRWAAVPAPIGYKKYVIYPFKERPMTPASHPAFTPWLGVARIAQPVAGQLLATVTPESSTVRRGEVTFVTTWTAEKRS